MIELLAVNDREEADLLLPDSPVLYVYIISEYKVYQRSSSGLEWEIASSQSLKELEGKERERMRDIWTGVTKLWSYNDSENYYRATCSCGSADHNLDVNVELVTLEDKTKYLQLVFNTNVYVHDEDEPWYRSIWWRIKAAFKILRSGWLEGNHDFIFRDERHINDFLDALQQGIDEVSKGERDGD